MGEGEGEVYKARRRTGGSALSMCLSGARDRTRRTGLINIAARWHLLAADKSARIQTRVLSADSSHSPPRLIPRVTPRDENERAEDSRPD